MGKCKGRVEVYSRTVGFFRPVQDWNPGKTEEFNERKTYDKSIKPTTQELGTRKSRPDRQDFNTRDT